MSHPELRAEPHPDPYDGVPLGVEAFIPLLNQEMRMIFAPTDASPSERN